MHSINSKTDILVVGLVFIGFDAEYFTLGEGGGGRKQQAMDGLCTLLARANVRLDFA